MVELIHGILNGTYPHRARRNVKRLNYAWLGFSIGLNFKYNISCTFDQRGQPLNISVMSAILVSLLALMPDCVHFFSLLFASFYSLHFYSLSTRFSMAQSLRSEFPSFILRITTLLISSKIRYCNVLLQLSSTHWYTNNFSQGFMLAIFAGTYILALVVNYGHFITRIILLSQDHLSSRFFIPISSFYLEIAR